MSSSTDQVFETLLNKAREFGFVNDEAEEKLREFVDMLRLDEDEEDEPEICAGCGGVLEPDDGDQDDDFCAECRAKGLTGTAVPCKFCGKFVPASSAHRHDGSYVGECCWDDRLKATE